MSNLSTSVLRLAKLVSRGKLEVSTCEIFLISVFVVYLFRSILTFIVSPKCELNGLGFLSIQLLNELLYPFHLTYNLSPFLLIIFFYSKLFLTSFLQFFFVKTSTNFFTIQITNSIRPRNCIFDFINNKNFF